MHRIPYPADLPPEHEFFGDDSEVTQEERARFHDWVRAESQARQASAAEQTADFNGMALVGAIALFVYLFVDVDVSLNL